MQSDFVTDEIPEKQTSVALGVFDGVHKGHRIVLKEAAAIDYLEPWVFTFSEDALPTSKKDALRLEPAKFRYRIMKRCGIAHVYAPDFFDIKDLSGEEFVDKILVEHLKCKRVVCGTDFRFGKAASCKVAELKELCEFRGIECVVVDKLFDGEEAISSTRIRDAAEKGNMEEYIRLCGYPFCIEKEVTEGKHLGREYDIPTINQEFDRGYMIPRFGVYVSSAYIDGKFYPAVTNVGVRPTVSEDNIPVSETNIIGISENLYGKDVLVFLLGFVRDEMHFDSKKKLFERISCDRAAAEKTASDWINRYGSETKRILGL